MIRFFLLYNKQGQRRLSKWYATAPPDAERVKIENDIHRIIVLRSKKHTNFVEYRNIKIVYRKYAGLFFIFGVDVDDNELLAMESIHLFVELMDQYFSNVCELDIIFNFHKAYYIVDELFIGGHLQETSKAEVLRVCGAMDDMMEETNSDEIPQSGRPNSPPPLPWRPPLLLRSHAPQTHS